MPDSCHTPCKGRKASCTRPRRADSWLVPADMSTSCRWPLVLVKQSSLARAFRVAFLATASSFHQRQGVDCTIQHPCRRDQTCLRPCSALLFRSATDRTSPRRRSGCPICKHEQLKRYFRQRVQNPRMFNRKCGLIAASPARAATPFELRIVQTSCACTSEKVKERIIEYLAVRNLKQKRNPDGSVRGPILCFGGPPGVGKTSLGKSIARAMGREFIRLSLGGVRDEAEIRGHRRTYIGALPGRIIQNIKKAGTNNPVFMLDEVDKLGSDFRGDPSSALLEVLDPEQNHSFNDHYLELDFDLSKVMFIATANNYGNIPPALRDRMEILEFSGYIQDEKVQIAKRHLIPKQIKENGLKKTEVSLDLNSIKELISAYTREAGVRQLERQIANVLRKVARDIVESKKKQIKVTKTKVHDLLGASRFHSELAERATEPGVVTGLAWTAAGGDILFIESTRMHGKGKLTLTGQLGDVMKESATAGLTFVRAHANTFGIDSNFNEETDIHVHVPAGAIPKDGPSAGVSMVTSLVSLMTNIPVKDKVAMTGEITLRGNVLPIGGVKEKVTAAHRAGIKEVVLPELNRKDLEDVPTHVSKDLTFHFAKEIWDVLEVALPKVTKRGRKKLSK